MSSIFQFHKGTIRTDPRMPINEQHYHFNSIKVQLERKPMGTPQCQRLISIP